MVAISYNRDIPDAPNNPSQDQSLMKTNTNGTYDILDVDHITFNTLNGGTHKQTTFIKKFPAAAQTDPSSVLYTGSGTASANADLFYRNQNGVFRPNIIKAAGVFTTILTAPIAAVTLDNGFNVASISKSAANTYLVTFTANATSGNNAIVIFGTDFGNAIGAFTANTLTITGSAALSTNVPVKISFAVLQV